MEPEFVFHGDAHGLVVLFIFVLVDHAGALSLVRVFGGLVIVLLPGELSLVLVGELICLGLFVLMGNLDAEGLSGSLAHRGSHRGYGAIGDLDRVVLHDIIKLFTVYLLLLQNLEALLHLSFDFIK